MVRKAHYFCNYTTIILLSLTLLYLPEGAKLYPWDFSNAISNTIFELRVFEKQPLYPYKVGVNFAYTLYFPDSTYNISLSLLLLNIRPTHLTRSSNHSVPQKEIRSHLLLFAKWINFHILRILFYFLKIREIRAPVKRKYVCEKQEAKKLHHISIAKSSLLSASSKFAFAGKRKCNHKCTIQIFKYK